VIADKFLTLACLEYTDQDCPDRYAEAQSILDLYADRLEPNIYTASIIGDVDTVRRHLQTDPLLVRQKGGPRGWDPLLYLCYGRVISLSIGYNSLETARLLLEFGANPNTNFTYPYGSIFTAVTGALGEGERGPVNQPPHQYSFELARLLLASGASPNDGQALYNRMFSRDDETIKLLLEYGLNAQHKINWDVDSQYGMLDFLLGYAVKENFQSRVALLLKHGANPDSMDYYNRKSHYENAMAADNLQIAALLKQYAQTGRETRSELPGDKCD